MILEKYLGDKTNRMTINWMCVREHTVGNQREDLDFR